MADKTIQTNEAATEEKPKRKTYTSSAVKRRYNDKVYSRITVALHKKLVSDFKEAVEKNGTTPTAVIREAIENYIKNNG